MPKRDGTGPMGQGAMTGRGMGICNGGAYVPFGNGIGYGRRSGINCRRGYRGYYYTDVSLLQTQPELLKEQKELLERRLKEINHQIDQQEK